jgi:hypothetical protein
MGVNVCCDNIVIEKVQTTYHIRLTAKLLQDPSNRSCLTAICLHYDRLWLWPSEIFIWIVKKRGLAYLIGPRDFCRIYCSFIILFVDLAGID